MAAAAMQRGLHGEARPTMARLRVRMTLRTRGPTCRRGRLRLGRQPLRPAAGDRPWGQTRAAAVAWSRDLLTAPERIVQAFEYEGMLGAVMVDSMALTEQDGQTVLSATSRLESGEPAAVAAMLQSGMADGAAETDDRLEEDARTLTSGGGAPDEPRRRERRREEGASGGPASRFAPGRARICTRRNASS
jgi:hypothetical protein